MEERVEYRPPRLAPARLLIPLVFWLVLIFAFSAYPKAIIPQSKYFSWDKLAHLVEFGILGYLAARAAYFSGVFWINARWVGLTVIFGLLFAASDEWHQLHVPGRFATVYDVLADAVGVVVGLLIFLKSIRPAHSGG